MFNRPDIFWAGKDQKDSKKKMIISTTTPSKTPSLKNKSFTKTLNNHNRLLNLLSQCTSMSQLKQIQAQTLRSISPHHPTTLFLESKILHFSSLHDIDYAFKIFSQIQNPNSYIWNTMIRACSRSKTRNEEAINLYVKRLEEGKVLPDKHTYPIVLKACAHLFALSEGKQLHGHVFKRGFALDVYVNNSLIHVYASCGCLDDARDVFDEMPERSVVSWNAMIDALVLCHEFDDALKLFREMQNYFEPDGYAIISVLHACAGLGALSLGMWAHAYVLRKCDSDMVDDVLLNNALLDMYSKCGSFENARQVFERMAKRDVTSWNAMILGLGMHGKAEAALVYFTRMIREERLRPNSITFSGVLSACNHKGLVFEGRKYFDLMISEYDIEPVLEHYGCLVDLLARAGLIEEALDIVAKMPIKPDAVIWRSLLDACCKKNVGIEVSEEVAKKIMESEGGELSGVYVLLSKVYAEANKWNEVGLVRKLMTDKGIAKEPGCSSIEVYGVTHEFFAGSTSHPRTEEIYKILDEIEERLKLIGYVPDVSQVVMVDGLDDDGKRASLRVHSERLAIAFGLLSLEPGTPIRVFKNLRVCNDCHNVTKLISKMYNVEIIVRDRARFHHFRDGSCSCLGYW